MAIHSSVLAWRIPGTGAHGVAQSRTWLKRLSSNSSSSAILGSISVSGSQSHSFAIRNKTCYTNYKNSTSEIFGKAYRKLLPLIWRWIRSHCRLAEMAVRKKSYAWSRGRQGKLESLQISWSRCLTPPVWVTCGSEEADFCFLQSAHTWPTCKANWRKRSDYIWVSCSAAVQSQMRVLQECVWWYLPTVQTQQRPPSFHFPNLSKFFLLPTAIQGKEFWKI